MSRRTAQPVGLVKLKARKAFNDDRRRVFSASARPIAFVCECADPECRSSVVLTRAEYDEAREGPIVASGHELER
jgi:hypothetical protein